MDFQVWPEGVEEVEGVEGPGVLEEVEEPGVPGVLVVSGLFISFGLMIELLVVKFLLHKVRLAVPFCQVCFTFFLCRTFFLFLLIFIV